MDEMDGMDPEGEARHLVRKAGLDSIARVIER
jgi:hypothetical protein